MRILCSNDDGIHSAGLTALEDIARELTDDVWTVAPEVDQSGMSRSITLTRAKWHPSVLPLTGRPRTVCSSASAS